MNKPKKIYLTKKRLKQLDLSLSIDDILYEKHRRLMNNILEREQRLYRKGNVIKVIHLIKY